MMGGEGGIKFVRIFGRKMDKSVTNEGVVTQKKFTQAAWDLKTRSPH